MSPVPCGCAVVMLRYCQLRAASRMAADRYMGDRWGVLEGRLDCDGVDFSLMRARMCRVLSRDGSVRETFWKICREGAQHRLGQSAPTWRRWDGDRQQKHTHLLVVLGDDGLHGAHAGGFHHERDSLSLPYLHHPLEQPGVVVARRQCSYRHHLAGQVGDDVRDVSQSISDQQVETGQSQLQLLRLGQVLQTTCKLTPGLHGDNDD
ncbi:hypothetical protein EYF80_007208 [Liparis tanakae]|uniref:Uncharacterized protein n=1 Tax=Liparis tanakae TaxID=230148 RepID=A0A4Z2IXJ3_9TELE|nr:hypothetical protein EYF80_007208 [Liparis tanakae]